jgi:hypothetical protein
MAGAFSFQSRGRGTFQTRLSKLAGPPLKLRYRHVLLWWGLGLAILYWLFGYLVWLHQLSATRLVALFPQYAYAYSGVALFVLASLWWYNHGLLRDAEPLGANAVLNTCFDAALDIETLYHRAAV